MKRPRGLPAEAILALLEALEEAHSLPGKVRYHEKDRSAASGSPRRLGAVRRAVWAPPSRAKGFFRYAFASSNPRFFRGPFQ